MVLDQGEEGSCTGFGLAGVVNYLRWELANLQALESKRKRTSVSVGRISARMLYQNARLYDEWKGEDYEGSSCRGAMKGLHKHGVCSEATWPNFEKGGKPGRARPGWDANAPLTPLGAYYRIDGKSIVDMQSAIFETHAVYVSADVHDGWDRVKKNCKSLAAATIGPPNDPDDVGGHAFALVGYTSEGFIVQNSWGPSWGFHGFAVLPYEDWTRFGTDCMDAGAGGSDGVSFPAMKGKKGAKAQTPSAFRSPAMRTDMSLDERLRSRSMQRNRVASDTQQGVAMDQWRRGRAHHLHRPQRQRGARARGGSHRRRRGRHRCPRLHGGGSCTGFLQCRHLRPWWIEQPHRRNRSGSRFSVPGSRRTASCRSLWFGRPAFSNPQPTS